MTAVLVLVAGAGGLVLGLFVGIAAGVLCATGAASLDTVRGSLE